MAQKEYKRRHDNIARLVHWKLCCKYGLNKSEKWYEHRPDGVEENDRCKILWVMTIQCDHIIEARRPENDVAKEESNKATIVDIASAWDHREIPRSDEGDLLENYVVSDVWNWCR